MTHFSKYLIAIGWKMKTNGIFNLHGERLPTFVEDGDTSYMTYRPTWICFFFSRMMPLQ